MKSIISVKNVSKLPFVNTNNSLFIFNSIDICIALPVGYIYWLVGQLFLFF
ncbi:hypothetical protein [Mycoplasma capricolum]|uniref:hypothetical protein n=1 Tax=Mycoplasma capricolum TaxID=2095 RepID=UPI001AA08F2C|nr:hypothetical protein [Mycoplasma capricolum]